MLNNKPIWHSNCVKYRYVYFSSYNLKQVAPKCYDRLYVIGVHFIK